MWGKKKCEEKKMLIKMLNTINNVTRKENDINIYKSEKICFTIVS